MSTFSDFQLNPAIVKSLSEEGYSNPTPIQSRAIPNVLLGKDVLGIAQTGTGKTAAFALPILHRLAATRRKPMRHCCRVLVLSPTRELASQIAESFRTYGRYLGIRVAVVFGGVGHGSQRETLARGVEILVATPGRLLDHIHERNIVLDGVEMFVLDEADQMLDMGFIRPIRQIVAKLSARRQSLFFSATMPKEIGQLAGELLRDPVKVSVTPAATLVERVRQHVYLVDAGAKRALLVELLANPQLSRTLVFTRTKRGADRVAQHLAAAGIRVAAIHGNKSQNQREAALEAFKVSKIRALVATDVAARGIDIDLVTHVVNYELPNVPESYVHRIGRTARAGAEGMAISLCDAEERGYLRDIEHLIRQSIATTDRRRDASLALTTEPHDVRGRRPSRGQPHRQSGEAQRKDNGGRQGHPNFRSNNRNGQSQGTKTENRSGAGAGRRRHGERPMTNGPSGLENVAFMAFTVQSGRPSERDDGVRAYQDVGDHGRQPELNRTGQRAGRPGANVRQRNGQARRRR